MWGFTGQRPVFLKRRYRSVFLVTVGQLVCNHSSLYIIYSCGCDLFTPFGDLFPLGFVKYGLSWRQILFNIQSFTGFDKTSLMGYSQYIATGSKLF